jgi:molybdate transport system substrate-binding protein
MRQRLLALAAANTSTASQAVNDYPIAVIANRPQVELARAFTALVMGPDGRSVLDSAGFGGP